MMKSFAKTFVLGSAPFLGLNGPAQAQVGPETTSAILAACEIGTEDCLLLVQQAIVELQAAGLNQADFDMTLAQISAAVVQGAQRSPAADAVAASALRDIGNVATNPEQQAYLAEMATIVSALDDPENPSPLPASPS